MLYGLSMPHSQASSQHDSVNYATGSIMYHHHHHHHNLHQQQQQQPQQHHHHQQQHHSTQPQSHVFSQTLSSPSHPTTTGVGTILSSSSDKSFCTDLTHPIDPRGKSFTSDVNRSPCLPSLQSVSENERGGHPLSLHPDLGITTTTPTAIPCTLPSRYPQCPNDSIYGSTPSDFHDTAAMSRGIALADLDQHRASSVLPLGLRSAGCSASVPSRYPTDPRIHFPAAFLLQTCASSVSSLPSIGINGRVDLLAHKRTRSSTGDEVVGGVVGNGSSSTVIMPLGSPGLHSPLRSTGHPSRLLIGCNLGAKDRRPCDICGDVSAGFHCNAYVCEACKKFFIRSSKGDNFTKYTCTKSNMCEINKDTRTHCQRCRYQKCNRLGMVLPGKVELPPTDISEIPCRVCGAKSSGFHFGAITCEGCKGFFRRTINEREGQRYTCRNGGSCAVTGATRNNCKSCRYRRCLTVGMSKDGSRIGRQPNAVKHRCAIEIEQIRSAANISTQKSPNKYYLRDASSAPTQAERMVDDEGIANRSHLLSSLHHPSRSGQMYGLNRALFSPASSYTGTSSVPNANIVCLRDAQAPNFTDGPHPFDTRTDNDRNMNCHNITGSTNIQSRISNSCIKPQGQTIPYTGPISSYSLHDLCTTLASHDRLIQGQPIGSIPTDVAYSMAQSSDLTSLSDERPFATSLQGFETAVMKREQEFTGKLDVSSFTSGALGMDGNQVKYEHEDMKQSQQHEEQCHHRMTQDLLIPSYGETRLGSEEDEEGQQQQQQHHHPHQKQSSIGLLHLSRAAQLYSAHERNTKTMTPNSIYARIHQLDDEIVQSGPDSPGTCMMTQPGNRLTTITDLWPMERVEGNANNLESTSWRAPEITVQPATCHYIDHDTFEPHSTRRVYNDQLEVIEVKEDAEISTGLSMNRNDCLIDFTVGRMSSEGHDAAIKTEPMEDNTDPSYSEIREKTPSTNGEEIQMSYSKLSSAMIGIHNQQTRLGGSNILRVPLEESRECTGPLGSYVSPTKVTPFRETTPPLSDSSRMLQLIRSPSNPSSSGSSYYSPSKAFLNRYTATIGASRNQTITSSCEGDSVECSVVDTIPQESISVNIPYRCFSTSPTAPLTPETPVETGHAIPLSPRLSAMETDDFEMTASQESMEARTQSNCLDTQKRLARDDADDEHRHRHNQESWTSNEMYEKTDIDDDDNEISNRTPYLNLCSNRKSNAPQGLQNVGGDTCDATGQLQNQQNFMVQSPLVSTYLLPSFSDTSGHSSQMRLRHPSSLMELPTIAPQQMVNENTSLVQTSLSNQTYSVCLQTLEPPNVLHTAYQAGSDSDFVKVDLDGEQIDWINPAALWNTETDHPMLATSIRQESIVSRPGESRELGCSSRTAQLQLSSGFNTDDSIEPGTEQAQLQINRSDARDYTLSQSGLSEPSDVSTHIHCPRRETQSSNAIELFTGKVLKAARHLNRCPSAGWTTFSTDLPSSSETVWSCMMEHFNVHSHQVIQFARSIPGFRDLPHTDMQSLVQHAVYPIILVQMSRDYDVTTADYNYFQFTALERELIFRTFPSLRVLAEQLHVVGNLLKPLQLDETELALLCCIELFHSVDGEQFFEPSTVETLYQKAICALQKYERTRFSSETRSQSILSVSPILTNLSEEHHQIVKQLRHDRSDLHFPDLYLQLFRLDTDSEQSDPVKLEGTAKTLASSHYPQ